MQVDGTKDPHVLRAMVEAVGGPATIAGPIVERDAEGNVTANYYEVSPDIDLAQYDATAAALAKASLSAYANGKQWALATGGYTATVAGVARLFKTDDTSRGLITSKQLRLQQVGAPASVNWQFDGGFVAIAAADFTAAAIKVADFFQATFDAVEPVLAAITAGTITSTAQIDAAAWPANHD